MVRSWLVDLMEQTYRAEGGLAKVPAYVEDTGEVNWLVDDALHMEVPAPVISQAVIQLVASRDSAGNASPRGRHDAPRVRRASLWPGRGYRGGTPRRPGRRFPSGAKIMTALGHTTWVIPEGYIPSQSTGTDRTLISHEAVCILNAGDADAAITITLYFKDRAPVGPYHLAVPASRTRHFRFNDLTDPETVPRDTDYSSVIRSSVPVVVQHTRLDSRQPALALLSTIAFPVTG